MKELSIKNTVEELLRTLNPRMRGVIEKRFGLRSISCQTLEAIGQILGITRERVRQIESLGLLQLANENMLEPIKPAFEIVKKHLENWGGVRREDFLLKELSRSFSLKENNNENLINFVMALGKDKFTYFKETPKWRAAWALSADTYNTAINLADILKDTLIKKNSPTSREDILKILPDFNNGLTDAIFVSYIELCRGIAQNSFGEWGHINSPEISPKGVKDKAYLIFKKENKPLHFTQVAELINKVTLWDRKAHPQTVHNELIKDSRFVLVGRGTYVLADWGYEPGTVRDVLVSMLKDEKDGLTKSEIIEQVKAKRLVKENTIILNLQNKKVFKKLDNERFTLL
ncbi:MAG: sigma factor-like helix-turn-helix DNA-binding protein [Candidatus Azambacteria bacterium]|nr:sigma factor-like helix-turn-helix DNA-binding protein [Candidatus Azambacteria bacterium]